MKTRLQKVIADAGLASRREAERWIAEGRVKVNGNVVTKLGSTADPFLDEIRARGKLIPRPQGRIFILLNKPANFLTTMGEDERGRKTVMDLIKNIPARVFPVGRLDYNTQGALLLSSDGALSKKLLDPKYKVPRTYLVKVRGVPDEKTLRRLRRGVGLDNQSTMPLEAGVDRVSGKNSFVKIKMFEGKNRHVKRICEVIGHPVIRLKRTHFGNISLVGLPLGAYRFLAPREIKMFEGKNRHVKRICEVIGHPVIRLKRTHFGSLSLVGLPLGAYRFLSPREIKSLELLVAKKPEEGKRTLRRSMARSKRLQAKP